MGKKNFVIVYHYNDFFLKSLFKLSKISKTVAVVLQLQKIVKNNVCEFIFKATQINQNFFYSYS